MINKQIPLLYSNEEKKALALISQVKKATMLDRERQIARLDNLIDQAIGNPEWIIVSDADAQKMGLNIENGTVLSS